MKNRPDQSPETIRRYFEEQHGIIVNQEKVLRFMNNVVSSLHAPELKVEPDDAKATAAFIFELLQAAKYGESWEPYKKRLNLRKLIIKDDTFDPKLATIDDPEFRIVLESLREPIGYDSAICELSQMHHVSERTAKTWYAALKPAAEAILALEKDATKSLSNKND